MDTFASDRLPPKGGTRLVKFVRSAIEGTTLVSSADCGIIHNSTERAHGLAVLREQFESEIIRNLRLNFHGSRERMTLHGLRRQRLTLPLHLRRRISHAIGTSTMAEAVRVEVAKWLEQRREGTRRDSAEIGGPASLTFRHWL